MIGDGKSEEKLEIARKYFKLKMDRNNNKTFDVLLDHDYAKAEGDGSHMGNDGNRTESNPPEDAVEFQLKAGMTAGDKDARSNDPEDSLMKVGRSFKSLEELEGFMDAFMSQSKTAFVRKSCNKVQVLYECKHGTKRKQKCKKNARTIQHSIKFNCKAYVRFSRRVNGDIILTSFSLNHNTPTGRHLISDAIYHRDTDSGKIGKKEEALIETLLDANCNAGQIAKMLALKKNLMLTSSAVRYKIKKLKDGEEDGCDKLEAFLAQIEEEGGIVNKMENEDGTVRVLNVITKEMKKGYLTSMPSVIQIDTTYNFEVSGYKLCCIVYLNPGTGKGEVAMMSFMEDECKEAYTFVFQTFRDIISEDPTSVMIDKDFCEIQSLSSVFLNSHLLLCWFHVLKWIKGLINTALADMDQKSIIMDSFRRLLYAHNSEAFEAELKYWYEVIAGVEIRVGSGEKKHYTSLKGYYDKNWGSCKEMWTFFLRKNLPGLGEEFTNNRIERAFGVMKRDLKLYTTGEVNFFKAVMHLVRWAENQLSTRYTTAQRHRIRIHDPDPAVRDLYLEAADVLNDTGCMMFKLSMERLRERKCFMKVEDSGVKELHRVAFDNEDKSTEETFYKTTDKKCNCSFWARHFCPCRHILLFREWHCLPLFDKSLFSSKYDYERIHDMEIAENLDGEDFTVDQGEVEDDIDDVEEYRILSREEKYKLIQPIMGRLSDVLLQFGSEQIHDYVEELEVVEQRLRLGQNILQNSKSKSSKVDKEGQQSESEEQEGNGSDAFEEEIKLPAKPFKLKIKGKVRRRGRPRGGGSKVRFCGKNVRNKMRKRTFLFKRPVKRLSKPVIISDHNSVSPRKIIQDLRKKVNGSRKSFQKRNQIKGVDKNVDFISDISDTDEANVSDLTETIEITNSPPPNPSQPPIPLICYFPSYPGSRRSLNLSDFSSLRPKNFVTDVTLDFAFCYENFFHVHEKVCLLSTEFAQILAGGHWWNDKRLKLYLEESKLWQPDGAKIVLLPVCHASHFYCLAAVLDEDKPIIVVLESLGGSFSIEPPVLKEFESFLSEQKQLLTGSQSYFEIVCPIVPRQRQTSNDCGLFVIKYMREIVKDPERFIKRVADSSLNDWFPVEEVDGLRRELADLLLLLAKEQRLPGRELAGQDLTTPDIDFRYVCGKGFR